jgi:hypothetical protein
LLAALESRPLPEERLRAIRAMQLLERLGSAEAREFLEELSRGAASARLTRDAQEALTRLKTR